MSNIGKLGYTTGGTNNFVLGQGFTTGGSNTGYTLSSIETYVSGAISTTAAEKLKAEMWSGEGERQDQSALATSRGSSKATEMRSGRSDAINYWALLFWAWLSLQKPLSQIQRSAFSSPFPPPLAYSFGGLGLLMSISFPSTDTTTTRREYSPGESGPPERRLRRTYFLRRQSRLRIVAW